MAILTIPSVSKGVAATITLDKSELAAHSDVSEDSYYSNQDKWYKVTVYYQSNPGNQTELVQFDPSEGSPTATFYVSSRARDDFEVQGIRIFDFDGGNLYIPRANLTTAEFDISMGAAAPSEYGYSLAGFEGVPVSNEVRTTDQYNYVADSWTNKADCPLPARKILDSCSAIGTYGYLYGGLNESSAPIADCDEYDSSGNSWASKTDLQTVGTRFGNGASTIGTYGYVYGGGHNSPPALYDDCDRFDPSGAGSWTAMTSMAFPGRAYCSAETEDSKAYVFGGTADGVSGTNANEEYDPAVGVGGTWSSKTSLPSPSRWSAGTSAIGLYLYVVGGYNSTVGNELVDCDEYYPDGNSWVSKADMPSDYYEQGCTTLNSKVYTFGGHNGNSMVRDCYSFTSSAGAGGGTWTSVADLIPTGGRTESGAISI